MSGSIFHRLSTGTEPIPTAAITGISTALILGAFWAFADKQRWEAFGTGGTPPTWAGYWKVQKLGFFRLMSKENLRDHAQLNSEGPRHLSNKLPNREGSRPQINHWTLPQRQAAEVIEAAVLTRLQELPQKYANRHPDILYVGLSATEGKSGTALYAKEGDLSKRSDSAHDPILKDEIAHAHPRENSLHIWLSEADCKEVTRTGWGERFPLSAMHMVHPGWTFIYAPRNMDEMDVVEDIWKAGIAHVTGVSV